MVIVLPRGHATLSPSFSLSLTGEQGLHTLITSQKERKKERYIKRKRRREGEEGNRERRRQRERK
jgi:hypothetical protein